MGVASQCAEIDRNTEQKVDTGHGGGDTAHDLSSLAGVAVIRVSVIAKAEYPIAVIGHRQLWAVSGGCMDAITQYSGAFR